MTLLTDVYDFVDGCVYHVCMTLLTDVYDFADRLYDFADRCI